MNNYTIEKENIYQVFVNSFLQGNIELFKYFV